MRGGEEVEASDHTHHGPEPPTPVSRSRSPGPPGAASPATLRTKHGGCPQPEGLSVSLEVPCGHEDTTPSAQRHPRAALCPRPRERPSVTAASCCCSARGRSCKGRPATVAAVCALSTERGGGSGSGFTAQAPAHPILTCGGGSLHTQTLRLRVGAGLGQVCTAAGDGQVHACSTGEGVG